MSDDVFQLVEQTLESGGLDAGIDLLAARFREEKKYPQLFEARLMKKRRELGLPLSMSGTPEGLAAEPREAYEKAFIDAAREAGGLFLADSDIERAWPYFRALGETAPVAEAIERVQPRDGIDRVIEIALHERVNPRKGFELILGHYGICRAIGFYEQYPDPATRPACLGLLIRTLHSELAESLKRTIASVEGRAPETSNIDDLIAGRDWMFEGNNYYVDTSHVIAILRFALDLEDPDLLRKTIEIAGYGDHLSATFHYKVDAPFEDVYKDHAVYLRALLGIEADAAAAHFRRKVEEADPERSGSGPAQVLIGLLMRLGRYGEAAGVSLTYLKDVDPSMLACPTAIELCRKAGDWTRVKQLAREKDDPLSYLAAAAALPG